MNTTPPKFGNVGHSLCQMAGPRYFYEKWEELPPHTQLRILRKAFLALGAFLNEVPGLNSQFAHIVLSLSMKMEVSFSYWELYVENFYSAVRRELLKKTTRIRERLKDYSH